MLRWINRFDERVSESRVARVLVLLVLAAIVLGAIFCPMPDPVPGGRP